MVKPDYQANWRGAKRYRFDEEIRMKKAARAKSRKSFVQWLQGLPPLPVALLLLGAAGAGYSGIPVSFGSLKAMVPGSGCAIKGNISASGERIYHVPGQSYYRETTVAVHRGERWFCDEAEARRAGWRRSKV